MNNVAETTVKHKINDNSLKFRTGNNYNHCHYYWLCSVYLVQL